MKWRIPLAEAATRLEKRYTASKQIDLIKSIVSPLSNAQGYLANAILMHVPVRADITHNNVVIRMRFDRCLTMDGGLTLTNLRHPDYWSLQEWPRTNPTVGRLAFWYARTCIDETLHKVEPRDEFLNWTNVLTRRILRWWRPILEDRRSLPMPLPAFLRHNPYPEKSPPDEDTRPIPIPPEEVSSDPAHEFGYLDISKRPKNKTYEWKRESLMGKDDPTRRAEVSRTGWKFVPAKRHPEVPSEDPKKKIILYQGMVLMEKPTKKVTEDAEALFEKSANAVATVQRRNMTILGRDEI